jgi:hypothetical protein
MLKYEIQKIDSPKRKIVLEGNVKGPVLDRAARYSGHNAIATRGTTLEMVNATRSISSDVIPRRTIITVKTRRITEGMAIMIDGRVYCFSPVNNPSMSTVRATLNREKTIKR